MLKIENVEVMGWEHAIRGMRNPKNSWEKSDSEFEVLYDDIPGSIEVKNEDIWFSYIGPKDKDLMMTLRNAGTDHRKFMRMITVYLDITAPLYWWKEFDTYKVGTVANSCSTMHTIHKREFDRNDFSSEHVMRICEKNTPVVYHPSGNTALAPIDVLDITIAMLNKARDLYLQTKDKQYWWQMIQLLPSSYNQKRTVMLNYEVLANMYKSRKDHKLDEWHDFCDRIKELPYSELITGSRKIPTEDEIARFVEEAMALDPRIASYEIRTENDMLVIGLCDEDGYALYAFDIKYRTLADAIEYIKNALKSWMM